MIKSLKYILPHTFWALALAGSYYLHFTHEQKVAYVDSAELLAKYQGMIDARQAYQQQAEVWQANIDTLQQEIQIVQVRYNEQGSPAANHLEKELKAKQEQLVHYQRVVQKKATQEDQQMTEKVLVQVNTLIEEYGKQHDYRIILVANGSGNIAYAAEGANLTEELTQVLNKAYVP